MCGGPAWKREDVPDHKFDFVDTREFTDNGFAMRMKYLFLYLVVLKSFLVYVSDIFTAVTMLTTTGWSNDIFNSCPKEDPQGCIPVDFNIGKWVFFGCIIFSFLLLAYEARKSKKVIKSRDISYAFTNIMANHYYSLRSYDHFCFFDHISNSTKKKDDFAFFVFFTFKSWKRLLLADGPRQAINAITLYSFYLSKEANGNWYDVEKYFTGRPFVADAMTCTILFTVLVFAGSMLLLMIAGVCYIPLLCYVQGNLKEYVCHKVDKRIAEIIRRRNKQRQAKAAALARKEAAGDYSHLKNKKGALMQAPLPQPTLPNVSIDDDDLDDRSSQRTRVPGGAGSMYSADQKYSAAEYANEYPPMPGYHAASGPPGAYPFQGYGATNGPAGGPGSGGYVDQNKSAATVYDVPDHYYESDYGNSTAALAAPRDPARVAGQDRGLGQERGTTDSFHTYDDGHGPYVVADDGQGPYVHDDRQAPYAHDDGHAPYSPEDGQGSYKHDDNHAPYSRDDGPSPYSLDDIRSPYSPGDGERSPYSPDDGTGYSPSDILGPYARSDSLHAPSTGPRREDGGLAYLNTPQDRSPMRSPMEPSPNSEYSVGRYYEYTDSERDEAPHSGMTDGSARWDDGRDSGASYDPHLHGPPPPQYRGHSGYDGGGYGGGQAL